tara:strand:+ start:70 stop:1056 length:987 start_codon:yes stop_codon:yes gene_type:complete
MEVNQLIQSPSTLPTLKKILILSKLKNMEQEKLLTCVNTLAQDKWDKKKPQIVQAQVNQPGDLLRKFHGWIKRNLILMATEYLRINKISKKISVLDLAIGKFGDLHSLTMAGVSYIYGLEIDKASIEEAQRRYKEKRGKKPGLTIKQADISKNPKEIINAMSHPRFGVWKKYLNFPQEKFDLVSCQMAIHYFFKSEETLDNFLYLVSQSLKSGGLFIGTTLDGSRINSLGPLFENSVAIIRSSTGNEYLFQFKQGENIYGGITGSKEYMVDTDTLISRAQYYDLKLFTGLDIPPLMSFTDWYSLYTGRETPDEQFISSLYFSFVFQKR